MWFRINISALKDGTVYFIFLILLIFHCNLGFWGECSTYCCGPSPRSASLFPLAVVRLLFVIPPSFPQFPRQNSALDKEMYGEGRKLVLEATFLSGFHFPGGWEPYPLAKLWHEVVLHIRNAALLQSSLWISWLMANGACWCSCAVKKKTLARNKCFLEWEEKKFTEMKVIFRMVRWPQNNLG